MKKNEKLSKDVSYFKYFSEKSEFIKLVGITLFGVLGYFEYYTFMILSQKLGVFSIQQRNYVFLVSKIVGRASFLFIITCATRKFLNFMISSVILVLSIAILIISLGFSESTQKSLGLVFTGKLRTPSTNLQ